MISETTLAALRLISERGVILSCDIAEITGIGKSHISARLQHMVDARVLTKTRKPNPRQPGCSLNCYSPGPRFNEVDLTGNGYLPRKELTQPVSRGSGQIAGRTYMRQFANWGRSGWH